MSTFVLISNQFHVFDSSSIVYTVLGLSLIKYIKVRTICTFHYLRIIGKFVFCRLQFVLALLQTQANQANGRFDNSSFSVFLLLGLKHTTHRFSSLSCALKFKTNQCSRRYLHFRDLVDVPSTFFISFLLYQPFSTCMHEAQFLNEIVSAYD